MKGAVPSPVGILPLTFQVVGSTIVSQSESMSGSQQYFPSALTIMSQGRAPTLMVATCSNELVSYTLSLLAVEIGTTANLPSGVTPTVFTTFCPKPIVFSFLQVLASQTETCPLAGASHGMTGWVPASALHHPAHAPT